MPGQEPGALKAWGLAITVTPRSYKRMYVPVGLPGRREPVSAPAVDQAVAARCAPGAQALSAQAVERAVVCLARSYRPELVGRPVLQGDLACLVKAQKALGVLV